MRRGSDNGFFFDDKGEFFAVNLGADYCAEHEFGIKDIKRNFGIPSQSDLLGYDACKIQDIPEDGLALTQLKNGLALIHTYSNDLKNITKTKEHHELMFFKNYREYDVQFKGSSIRIAALGQYEKKAIKDAIQKNRIEVSFSGMKMPEIKWSYAKGAIKITMNDYKLLQHLFENYDLKVPGIFYDDCQIATAWDDRSFGIVVKKKHEAKLKELYQAFLNKDVCIFFGGGGVFQNSGLRLGIYSKIPEDMKKTAAEADADHRRMLEIAEDTGIEKKLKKAGKSFFSLRPAWVFNKEKIVSAFPVKFWLNPTQQNNYNAGWYSVEELLQWIDERGPVVKLKKPRNEKIKD